MAVKKKAKKKPAKKKIAKKEIPIPVTKKFTVRHKELDGMTHVSHPIFGHQNATPSTVKFLLKNGWTKHE